MPSVGNKGYCTDKFDCKEKPVIIKIEIFLFSDLFDGVI